MFTHRTATPGRARQQRRRRRRRQLRLLPEPAARRLPRRHAQSTAVAATTLSYRGFFDYNADRYGVQVERLEVQPNFLPGDRLPAPHRLPPQLRAGALQPAARARSRTCASVTTQASLNYTTNTGDRLDTREQVGAVPDRVHQQRRRERHLHRQLRAAGAAVRHRPGHPHRRSAPTTSTRCSSPTPAASSASSPAPSSTSAGTFYGGDRQSIAVNTARAAR